MSREALEAWARENHITFVSRSSGQHTTDTVSRDALRNLWQAARAAALEEAAEVCMDKANVRLKSERTASYCNQRAAECAAAIRALKEEG